MRVQIDELMFEKILKCTKSFVSADNCRPILKYIRLDVKADELIFSALDGYKATRIHVQKKSPEEFTVFFPPFDFKASKGGARQVAISKENDVCKIEIETPLLTEMIYQFKQPTESAFDIHKVYDRHSSSKQKIAVNAAYLAQALNTIKAISNDYRKTAIIEIEGQLEPIIVKNKDKEFLVEELVLSLGGVEE